MGLFKQVADLFRAPVRSVPAPLPKVGSELFVESEALASNLTLDAKRTWLIRRREFGKLRKLRRHEAHPDAVQKVPYFSTSSFLKSEERVSTLKKIDEIEALMSMQWWKTDRLDLTKNT